jgi:hypothetical protein
MNFVANLLWLFRSFNLRRSSVESFVERDFFIRILFQVCEQFTFRGDDEYSVWTVKQRSAGIEHMIMIPSKPEATMRK